MGLGFVFKLQKGWLEQEWLDPSSEASLGQTWGQWVKGPRTAFSTHSQENGPTATQHQPLGRQQDHRLGGWSTDFGVSQGSDLTLPLVSCGSCEGRTMCLSPSFLGGNQGK